MSDTDLIKDKIDIVDLVGEYVQLKPAGVNHKGLCPFHQEKSPSFMVSRERQRWHCFGCSKGGDAFTFIQEIEGMDFVEALKYLANRAGVTLSRSFQNEAKSSEKNRLKEVNSEAARFYHHFLLKMDASKPARAYLKERGLTDETIDAWNIGFVPDQWDLLTKYLLKKGYSIDDLVTSGLTIKRDGASGSGGRGFYDRFRGRIMFPIRDVHGSVVGFTGRVLVETEKSGGKYVNTPQSPLYDKSRVVFGLSRAKKDIRQKDLIVMVEGQMDVIAAHQAGMESVVASSGTALTEEQVKLLKRYAKRIHMAFDADAAGVKAAKRGIDVAVQAGMSVRVIHIPDGAGKDPDECIKKDPAVWFRAVEEAEDVMQWYFRTAFEGRDVKHPKDKQAIANALLPEIRRIPYAVERDHWLSELSGRLLVDTAVLREDMQRIREDTPTRAVKAPKQAEETAKEPPREPTRLERLLEPWLMLLLAFPEDVSFASFDFDVDLSTLRGGRLYKAAKDAYTSEKRIEIDTIRRLVDSADKENPADVLRMKSELEFPNMNGETAAKEADQLRAQITEEIQKQKRKRLEFQIAEAEKAGDTETLTELLKQFQQINS